MGADEFSGLYDQSAPAISYTILSNNSCTTGRTITATIIDGTGVNTTTAKPRIYYKKSTDAPRLLAGSSY
jgi:hypothetical protein